MHKANTKDDTPAAASATATSAFSSARSDQDDEVMEADDGKIDDDAEGDGLDVMDEEEYWVESCVGESNGWCDAETVKGGWKKKREREREREREMRSKFGLGEKGVNSWLQVGFNDGFNC